MLTKSSTNSNRFINLLIYLMFPSFLCLIRVTLLEDAKVFEEILKKRGEEVTNAVLSSSR